jgi:hypothetical protein
MDHGKNTFRGQKGKNRATGLKNRFWGPKSVWSRILIEQEKFTFEGQKGKNKLSEPKN